MLNSVKLAFSWYEGSNFQRNQKKPDFSIFKSMKHASIFFLLLLLLTTACGAFKPPYYLKTYGKDYYWEGRSSTHTYRYWIDSIGEFRLRSTLLVDETDSIPINSFEKGDANPSWIMNDKHPNTHMLFFWSGYHGDDTLQMEVHAIGDTTKFVASDTFEEKEKVILLRKKKFTSSSY